MWTGKEWKLNCGLLSSNYVEYIPASKEYHLFLNYVILKVNQLYNDTKCLLLRQLKDNLKNKAKEKIGLINQQNSMWYHIS